MNKKNNVLHKFLTTVRKGRMPGDNLIFSYKFDSTAQVQTTPESPSHLLN